MISLDPLFSFSLLESLQMESNAQILSALMAGGAWKSSANALANVQVHTGLGFIRVPAVPLYMYIMYCHVLCCGGMFRVIQSVIVMAICYCIVVGVGFVLVFSLVFLFCAMYPSILLGGLRIQKRQGVKKQKKQKKTWSPTKNGAWQQKDGVVSPKVRVEGAVKIGLTNKTRIYLTNKKRICGPRTCGHGS
jgi:Na+-transporting methylmalonyl-CoA/oxaloacetate decarboxylase gamma subunit